MDIMVENEIVIDNQEVLDINGQEDEKIYPMSGIKVDKGFYTIYELKRRYDAPQKRIILDSDFQRENVWKTDRKAELIESVLMGLPLPIFYFNQDKYGRLIVIDGRQRLTALFEYIDNKFQLDKLKILPGLNKTKFSGLTPVLKGRIEDFQIQAHVILPPTPDRIKFDIFDRVNRGGMQLNKQEIRNALYQGEATKLLNRLVKSKEFAMATGNAFANETRMKDRYLLTRFLSFCFYRDGILRDEEGNPYVYRDDIDEILGMGMDALNRMDTGRIAKLEQKVLDYLEQSVFYFGSDAYRLNRGERKSPINMNVFETVLYALRYIPKNQWSIKKKLNEQMNKLLHSAEFRDNIDNHRDSALKVNWRLDEAEKLGKMYK